MEVRWVIFFELRSGHDSICVPEDLGHLVNWRSTIRFFYSRRAEDIFAVGMREVKSMSREQFPDPVRSTVRVDVVLSPDEATSRRCYYESTENSSRPQR
jgi:hypothetical protein